MHKKLNFEYLISCNLVEITEYSFSKQFKYFKDILDNQFVFLG